MQIREWLGIFRRPLTGLRYFRDLTGREGAVRVLIYHDISPAEMAIFAKQMELLAREYRVITPHDFVSMMHGDVPIRGCNVLITFDDGFRSNRVVAEQVLEPNGIHALFFVVTDFIDCLDRLTEKRLIADKILDGQMLPHEIPDTMTGMTWEDLEFLIEKGHTIGGHTSSHARLSQIVDPAELFHEVVSCREVLKTRLNTSVDFFAFPFGDIASIDTPALKLARSIYPFIFSGIRGGNDRRTLPWAIRRDAVPLGGRASYFRFIVEGGLWLYYRRRRRRIDSLVNDESPRSC